MTTSATPNTPAHEHGGDHDAHRPAAAAPTHAEAEDAAHAVDPHAIPDVAIVDVTKRFDDVTAVDAMSLSVASGAFYSFLGPSGCGKTTTLRMIAGFEQPTSGEIYLAGEPVAGVPPYRRNVNTVFQHYALFPHMNVSQNVGYGLRQKKASKADEARRVGEALELVRLSGYEARRTWELSGGQQQRVALARALVNHPTVLLLDEPLGALDRKLRHEMQIELKQLQREVGITFIYVTHDQEEALTMSDVIVVMRDGRIQQQGHPEDLYERPVNRFVAGFVGTSNFLAAKVVGIDAVDRRRDRGDGDRAADRRQGHGPGRQARGRRRGHRRDPAGGRRWSRRSAPRHRSPRPTEGPASTGQVRQGTYLGDMIEYQIDTELAGALVVRRQNVRATAGPRAFGPGEAVTLTWNDEANLVLGT